MRLIQLGANKTQINRDNGIQVFFSYSTPVACYIPGQGYLKTSTKYSVTTSKHITQWLDGAWADIVPQEEIDHAAKN
jgi:hypothetical protein